MNQQR